MYSVPEKVEADPTSLKVGGRGRVCVPRCRGADANAPQEPLPDNLSKKVKPIVDLSLINPDDEEFRQEILQFETKYHAAIIELILNILVDKSLKDINTLTKSLVYLVKTNTISPENFEAGLKETLYEAPDQYIDIPKFYDNIGIILAPHIEMKHITLAKTFDLCGTVIAANQGHLLLKAIIHNLKDGVGPTLVKAMWQESGLQLSQWMKEEQVPKWVADNKFEFLGDAGTKSHYQANPVETQSRLLQTMNSDKYFDSLKVLVQILTKPPQRLVPTSQQARAPSNISISTNMYSVPEKVEADPTSLKVGGRGRVCVPRCRGADANAPQEPLPDNLSKKVKPIVDLSLINPDDEEFRQEILQFETKYHAAIIELILNILVDKSLKDINTLTKSLVYLVKTNTISPENFEAGLKETLYEAPDQYIDIPKFYDNIGIILAPHIEMKHITLAKTFDLCGTVIAANQGHLLLKAIIHNLKDGVGPTLVKAMWQESGLQLSQWMKEEQVPKWVADNKFEFLGDAGTKSHYQANPVETQSRLLQTMNSDKYFDSLKVLVQILTKPPQRLVPTSQQARAPSNISISTNMYSVPEKVEADPTSLKVGGRGSVCVPRCRGADANAPQEPLPDNLSKKVKPIVDLSLINPDDEEFRQEILQFETKYHAAIIELILNILVDKSLKDINTLTKSLVYLVKTNTISPENFEAGLKETLYEAPDQYIDIPKFYDNIGIILAPHIEMKHITLAKTFDLCGTVIAANQGHLFLKAIIHNLKDGVGPTLVKAMWQESGLQLSQWMKEEQVPKWVADNKFEFLGDAGTQSHYQANPVETQSRLLQMMNSDENFGSIKGWVQDKLGKSHNEDWFMRVLIQAICEHALYGNGNRDEPHFNRDRMNKYVGLIHEFGGSKESREANCFKGVRQLLHNLELPLGLTLEIFQYLREQSLISLDS